MTAVRTPGSTRQRPRPAAAAPRPRSNDKSRTATPVLKVHGRRLVSSRVLVVFSAALLLALVAGGVAIQAQRVEAQHRIDQLRAELAEAQDLNRSLRADVALAESPERVIDAAGELNLVPPGPVVPLVPTVTAAPSDPHGSVASTDPSDDSETTAGEESADG